MKKLIRWLIKHVRPATKTPSGKKIKGIKVKGKF